MEAKRRGSNCSKISLKLKELIANKPSLIGGAKPAGKVVGEEKNSMCSTTYGQNTSLGRVRLHREGDGDKENKGKTQDTGSLSGIRYHKRGDSKGQNTSMTSKSRYKQTMSDFQQVRAFNAVHTDKPAHERRISNARDKMLQPNLSPLSILRRIDKNCTSRSNIRKPAVEPREPSTQKKPLHIREPSGGLSTYNSRKTNSKRQTSLWPERDKDVNFQTKNSRQNAQGFQAGFTFQKLDLQADEQLWVQEEGDRLNIESPLCVKEFRPCHDIYSSQDDFNHTSEAHNEVVYIPKPVYIGMFRNDGSCISLQMRAILLNWIGEVTEEFMFKREVFQTAVNYLDRFLEYKELEVNKSEFQLVGLACLYLASKFDVV